MNSVVAAYTVAWTVLMIYLFTLASRQRQIQRGLDALRAQSARPDTVQAAEDHGR